MTTNRTTTARRWAASFTSFSLAAAVLLGFALPANAVIVSTVALGSAADYGVLAGSSVTNAGATSVQGNVGVWSGTSISGAPVATGTTEPGTPAAHQAQDDLALAYGDAATRTVDTDIGTELGSQTLGGGVYATPAHDPLSLNGALVLDGGNDPNTVFIIQTDSTLTTAANSSVTLINDAQECNVFWQVGSSATLAGVSTIAGSVLAHDSITLDAGVTVRGRLLAMGAAITMDTDAIVAPTCDLTPVTTTTTADPGTTTTTAAGTTTTTADAGTTTTTAAAGTTTTTADPGTSTTTAAAGTTTTTAAAATTTTTADPGTTTTTTAGTTTTTAAAVTTTTSGATTTTDPATTTTVPRTAVTTAPAAPPTANGIAVLAASDLSASSGLDGGLSAGRPGVPGISGPPKTGGAPLSRSHAFPWLPIVFAVLFVGAGMAFLPQTRRRHDERSR